METRFFLEKVGNFKGQFSKKYKALINYINTHYKEIAFMTLTDFSKATGISESTIVRFAVTLGYSGYPAFRKDFQQMVRSELTTFERFKLFSNGRDHQNQMTSPFKKSLQIETENIQKLLESIRQEDLEQVIHYLSSAKDVFIAGAQSTEWIAQYFGYHLSIISDNIHIITRANGEAVNILRVIDRKSLVFLISLLRYPRALMNVGLWAKKKGAKVIVITDNIISPFKDIGDVFLIVPTTFISFLYTNAALVALVNCIVVEFGSKQKRRVMEHLKHWEETNKFQSIFA